MAITAAQVKAFAPEFAAVADSIIDTWLSFAPTYISPARYQAKTDQGTLLWTCHVLTRTADGAAVTAGPVTKDRVRDVERENGQLQGTMAQNAWNSTGYGQQLLALARTLSAGGWVA